MDIHDAAHSKVASLVRDLGATLQCVETAISVLHGRDVVEDGRRMAMMALILKIEFLSDGLKSQAEILQRLRDGTLSPREAGFPEFEILDG